LVRPRSSIIIILALAIAAALAPATAAGAQPKKRQHAIDATMRLAIIGANATDNFYAGQITGKPWGTAALLARNRVSGSESIGQAVIYATRGTVKATIVNQVEPQPDGSVRFPGTFKITGGTGRYKGARGKGEFNGVLPAGSGVFTFELRGNIRY
jgi:hypothetical protein